MKIRCLVLLLAMLLMGITSCLQNRESDGNVTSYDWILGNWQRSNEQPDKITYEYWQKTGAKAYRGLGFTLMNGDTTFREDLKILRRNSAWWLEVTGTDNVPVAFRIVAVKEKALHAENLENPFPKYIKYEVDGGLLNAVVADEENEIEFVFKPIGEPISTN